MKNFINVTRKGYFVELSEDACRNVKKPRNTVEKYINTCRTEYGIITWLGKYSNVVISK